VDKFYKFLFFILIINKSVSEVKEFHRLGQKAYKKGDYISARKCFQKALKPSSALFYNIGATYLKEDNLREAEKHYRLTIKLNPEFIPAYNNLAITYIRLNELNKAEQIFRTAIEKAPHKYLLYYNLASLFILMDRLKEAELMYKEAIKLCKSFAQAYNNLGIVYYTQDRLEEAKETFRKAVRIDKKEPAYYYNLGECLIKLRDKEERIIWTLRQYIMLEKKDTERIKYILSLFKEYIK